MFFELFILLLCLICYLHYNKIRKLPPGPFSIPIIGSMTGSILGSQVFKKEYHKYGDMYSILVGPHTTLVIINDLQLTKDLFSRDEFSGI